MPNSKNYTEKMLTLDTFQARPLCWYKSLMKFPWFIAAGDFQLLVSTTEQGGALQTSSDLCHRTKITSSPADPSQPALCLLLGPLPAVVHCATTTAYITSNPNSPFAAQLPLFIPCIWKAIYFLCIFGTTFTRAVLLHFIPGFLAVLAGLAAVFGSQLLGILRGAQCLKLGAGFRLRLQAPSRVGGLFHTSRIWHSCSSIPI